MIVRRTAPSGMTGGGAVALAAPEPLIDAGREFLLGDEPTDVMSLEKSHVESFLATERPRGEQRPWSTERGACARAETSSPLTVSAPRRASR